MSRLLESGIKPNFNVTVSAATAPGLRALVEWIYSQGLTARLSVVRPSPATGRSLAALLEDDEKLSGPLIDGFREALAELRNPRYHLSLPGDLEICELQFDKPTHGRCCGIGLNHIVVGPDGRIAACPMTIGGETFEPAGDVCLAAYRAFPYDGDSSPADSACTECQWYGVCGGGCPVVSLLDQGAPFRRSSLCHFWRFVIPEYLTLFADKVLQSYCIYSSEHDLKGDSYGSDAW